MLLHGLLIVASFWPHKASLLYPPGLLQLTAVRGLSCRRHLKQKLTVNSGPGRKGQPSGPSTACHAWREEGVHTAQELWASAADFAHCHRSLESTANGAHTGKTGAEVTLHHRLGTLLSLGTVLLGSS